MQEQQEEQGAPMALENGEAPVGNAAELAEQLHETVSDAAAEAENPEVKEQLSLSKEMEVEPVDEGHKLLGETVKYYSAEGGKLKARAAIVSDVNVEAETVNVEVLGPSGIYHKENVKISDKPKAGHVLQA